MAKQTKQLNYLAQHVYSVLCERGYDEYYLANKRAMLISHKTVAETLEWAGQFLDGQNLGEVAERVHISPDELRVAAKVLALM